MWLFTCAEPRKPTKPSSDFKVHRPPSSEWIYGAWVGSSHRQELARRQLAGHERHGTKPEPSQKRGRKHEQHGDADKMRAKVQQQSRRDRVKSADAHWATLGEIEANERYGPRGRNERYERGGTESVDERFEPAYAKLIAQSARQGRSHRRQNNVGRDRREQRDPWKADVGVTVPKVSKFRENISR